LLFFFGVIIYSIVSTVTVEIPKCETIKSKDSFEINC